MEINTSFHVYHIQKKAPFNLDLEEGWKKLPKFWIGILFASFVHLKIYFQIFLLQTIFWEICFLLQTIFWDYFQRRTAKTGPDSQKGSSKAAQCLNVPTLTMRISSCLFYCKTLSLNIQLKFGSQFKTVSMAHWEIVFKVNFYTFKEKNVTKCQNWVKTKHLYMS